MAHFYAQVRGAGPATSGKGGTKDSGLRAQLSGWRVGVRVELVHEAGRDVVRVWRTGGPEQKQDEVLIAEYSEVGL
jgi:hypothetical protein